MLSAWHELKSADNIRGRYQLYFRIEWFYAVALCLSVLGWSLLWASALSIVPFISPWVGTGMFAAGFLLIPFAQPSHNVAEDDE